MKHLLWLLSAISFAIFTSLAIVAAHKGNDAAQTFFVIMAIIAVFATLQLGNV